MALALILFVDLRQDGEEIGLVNVDNASQLLRFVLSSIAGTAVLNEILQLVVFVDLDKTFFINGLLDEDRLEVVSHVARVAAPSLDQRPQDHDYEENVQDD